MKNTFVLQTDDNNFKKAISEFLSKHCKDIDVNVAIYEMNQVGADEVMKIVKEK
jgi:hypothetical protein